MEEKQLNTYPEEGKCPICGSNKIYFSGSDIDSAGLTYHAECEECGTTFCECYDLVFAGHWNIEDKEGNRYEDLPT